MYYEIHVWLTFNSTKWQASMKHVTGGNHDLEDDIFKPQ